MSDSFLRELWEKREKENKPETSPAFRVYQDIFEAVRGVPELEKQRQALEDSIINYYSCVKSTSRVSAREGVDVGSLTRSDEVRTVAHDRVIDELNILSRMCVPNRRSNEWRRSVGDSRDQIGEWAATVGKELAE